jgi:insertion element IS1 protein InsB
MPGDRSAVTCEALWHKIPASYKHGLVYTDFWEAYHKVVPAKQHRPGGKKEGQTNHVERFNLTLRQRLARLTRKTLSFSKSYLMHLICLRHFFYDYNRYCIHRFN